MATPEPVVKTIVCAIENDRPEVYIGWPERLFVRVNALMPRLVDRSLIGKSGWTPGIAKKSPA